MYRMIQKVKVGNLMQLLYNINTSTCFHRFMRVGYIACVCCDALSILQTSAFIRVKRGGGISLHFLSHDAGKCAEVIRQGPSLN